MFPSVAEKEFGKPRGAARKRSSQRDTAFDELNLLALPVGFFRSEGAHACNANVFRDLRQNVDTLAAHDCTQPVGKRFILEPVDDVCIRE